MKLLFLLLGLCVSATAGGPSEDSERDPTAAELIGRAVELAERNDDLTKMYGSELRRRVDKLNSDGQIRESSDLTYAIRPKAGELEFSLLEFNGCPPTPKELRSETRRRESFDEDAGGFLLNRELTQRYDLELIGREGHEERRSYVIRFKPKPGRLPERTKVDCVLNRLAGKIWVDKEDGTLAKIQYNLLEPAKFWLGLLGSVTDMRGELIYSRVDAGVWLPRSVDVDLAGRLLFSSLGQRIRLRWSGYAKQSGL